jgi:putative oxidoreductase
MDGLGDNRSSHRYLSYADGFATAGHDALLLVARILVGWIYLQSGWSKLANVPGFAAGMANRGVPELLGYAAPFVEFVGGLALVLGFATRYAAVLLILFTIAATWISHSFWTFPDAERARQFTQFWKNVTMAGGLLALFVTAGGRLSLDYLLRRRTA